MNIEKYLLKIINYFNFENTIIKREDTSLYLTRYYVFRKQKWWQPSLYIHCFHSSDYDYELHNHPWKASISLILSGSYCEERRIKNNIVRSKVFSPGSVNFILGTDFHRVDLMSPNVWTLFLSGPKIKDWGFWDRNTYEYTQWEKFIVKKEKDVG